MGLFDFLGDPASKWKHDPGLKLEADLEAVSLCGVKLGARPESLSSLGPPSNKHPTKKGSYTWSALGVEAYSQKGILEAYTLTFNPLDLGDMKVYSGTVLCGGKALDLGPASRREDIVGLLGEPWHEYVEEDDPDDAVALYYETRTLEWEIELLHGTLGSIVICSPPGLATPQARKWVHCEKPWPP